MSIKYLTYEQVVELNREVGGPGAGVRDEERIRSALDRLGAGFLGEETYPSVLQKAAVLIHGLASTQGFFDGNKRTAWTAALIFLGGNGVILREVSDIEAVTMIMTLATEAFATTDDPDRVVTRAVEWLEAVRLRASDRLQFAFLAVAAEGDEAIFSAERAGSEVFAVSGLPGGAVVPIILRVRFDRWEFDAAHSIRISVPQEESEPIVPITIRGPKLFEIPPENILPLGTTRWTYSNTLILPAVLNVMDYGTTSLRVTLDGQLMVELPVSFVPPQRAPDDASSLL